MVNKILSPIQVWQGYNPTSTPLNVAISKISEIEGIIYKTLFFTAENLGDEPIRVFATIAYKQGEDKRPAVLYIPDEQSILNKEIIISMVDSGYVVAVINYSGIGEQDCVTTYPKEWYYGNYENAKEHMSYTCGNAKESSWYLWVMIVRRAITLLEQEVIIDSTKIALMGYLTGAAIGWQVAGSDGRVSAFLPINNCGYQEQYGKSKYDKSDKIDINEDITAWLAGIAPQAYARFITCPILYVGTTNSREGDIDRLPDILHLVPSKYKAFSIYPRMDEQLTLASYYTMKNWFVKIFDKIEPTFGEISLDINNSEGKLYATCIVEEYDKVDRIEVYYSEKELKNYVRNWQKIKKYIELGNGEYLININPTRAEERSFIFVNVYYIDGTMLSSKMLNFIPKEMCVEVDNNPYTKRVLYDASMGIGTFAINSNKVFMKEEILSVKEGANGICGISCSEGDLFTYNVGAARYLSKDDSILQLDAWTISSSQIEIIMVCQEVELEEYVVRIMLSAQDTWQKLRLEAVDFKSRDMVSLKNFANLKKIVFKNTANIVFNNILWV